MNNILFLDLVQRVDGGDTVIIRDTIPSDWRPFANEHACRLRDPKKYERFRRQNAWRRSENRRIDAIWGITSGGTVELQALRYPTQFWSERAARAQCAQNNGILFEAASEPEGRGTLPADQ